MNRPSTDQAFISYRSVDRPVVFKVAAELAQRDCRCFVDQWYLALGRDWVPALEQALAESRSVAVLLGAGEMGRWQQRERAWALDRYAENPDNFAVVPVLLPGCEPPLGFLKQLTWIDLRDDPVDSGQLDRLAAALRGELVSDKGQRQPNATVCPYRGLLYFRELGATRKWRRLTAPSWKASGCHRRGSLRDPTSGHRGVGSRSDPRPCPALP
ncbi:MAG: toll/interleukin-1 receptor domain-containing protein [Pirellulales bacterium]